MTTETIKQFDKQKASIYLIPGYYSWQDFQIIKNIIAQQSGVKISYLDGKIEIMTIGEEHEIIKSLIGLLLGLYFFHQQIEFIPVGSATRESEEKGVSFEPDQSYYIKGKKENPDLAIEVNLTSGNPKKLEKYKRFKIREVWFWQNNTIVIYCLRDTATEGKIKYVQVNRSELLPELDLKLLASCVLMDSKIEAMEIFIKSINH